MTLLEQKKYFNNYYSINTWECKFKYIKNIFIYFKTSLVYNLISYFLKILNAYALNI